MANGQGPVAIVAHTHPSISKGGAEIAAYTLYQGLLAEGSPAIFIAVCPAADRGKLVFASGGEFALIAEADRYDHFYELSSHNIWTQLRDILLREQVSLVNFHHFTRVGVNSLRALAAETGIPFTITFHEYLAICTHHGQMVTRPARRLCPAASPAACATCYPEHTPAQFALRREVIRNALLHAAAFVAPSQFLADRLIAWGLPPEKFTVIENGLRRMDPVAPANASDFDRGWTFGYFGQLTPYKGIDILLEALEILARQPDIGRTITIRIHGNIIGHQDDFESRFDNALSRHRFATYAGPYDNLEVGKLMAACDYVLTPSTWWENSPVVIQEAFAAGRPVICADIGGMAEKVRDGKSGLQFRARDPADLAATILRACDRTLYRTLCSGIPAASGQAEMARAYAKVFQAGRPPVSAKRSRKLLPG